MQLFVTLCHNSFLELPKMHITTALPLTSWVGQTQTLKCRSDGVLTLTLTWYQPDGNEKFRVTNKEITVQVGVNNNGNCGNFWCVSENGLTSSEEKIVKIAQISKLNKSDATIILGQRPTSSKLFQIQSRTPQNSSSIHKQVSGFVLTYFLKINS